jgi:hypothetical protein
VILKSLRMSINPEPERIDRFIFNSLFGLALPILCFLLFWWGSLLFASEEKIIMISALTGLGIGIIISLLVKILFKPDIYGLSKQVLVLIYLFFNFGMFGFFMGVPVFHPILGIIAGYYWSKRLKVLKCKTNYRAEIKRISLFTAIVIGIVCICSAVFALMSKSTPSDLKQMLNLSFDVSQSILVSLILFGGLFLILIQYLSTKVTMKKVLKLNEWK